MASLIGSLSNVPILGDAVDMFRGDPDAIKAAYDKAMAASGASSEKIRQFLMGQQGKAQAFYGPLQQMFSRAYGQGNIAPPQTPGVPGSTPLTSMFNRSQR